MFYSFFQVVQKNTEGKQVYKIGNGQWNIPQLRVLLEDILPKNIFFENFKVEHNFPKIGRRIMVLNARRIYTTGQEKPIMLLAIEDITKQVHLENHLKDYTKKLSVAVAKRTGELEARVKELERKNKIVGGGKKKKIASLKLKSKFEI